jgi:hypothetical protein
MKARSAGLPLQTFSVLSNDPFVRFFTNHQAAERIEPLGLRGIPFSGRNLYLREEEAL